jgi:hypothetical protein
VKASNILFDDDRRIQIAHFSPIRLETGEVEPFSGEEWAPTFTRLRPAFSRSRFIALLLTPSMQMVDCLLPPLFQPLFRG